MKKLISVILSALLVAAVFALPVQAQSEQTENKKPLDVLTVFVEGICTGDVIDAQTGEALFPPTATTIAAAVAKQLPFTVNALLKGDDEKVIDTLVDGVMDVCSPCAMDENGNPTPDTAFDFQYPSEESIKEVVQAGEENHRITFSYDWRLDMKTIATELHSYIEYAMAAAGVDKINLVGFSMGSTVVMSYLKLYENEYSDYVKGVVLLAGGYNGTSCCGEPFARKVELDKTALISYVDSMLGCDLKGIILSSLVHQLGTLSLTQSTLDLLNAKIDDYIDAVYEGMFMQTFGSMPGLWSLIPDCDYDEARKYVPDNCTDEFIDKIDWYHNNVAPNRKQIIDNLLEKNLRFGIIAKYGYQIAPVTVSKYVMSDGVIDTKYESWGATCADIGSTLGDGYVQKVNNGYSCISPDNLIDSSTCEYCDKTWFFKNCPHSSGLDDAMELFTYIFYNDTQPTVFDGKYPQYLINIDGQLTALTGTNYTNLYFDDVENDTFFNVISRTLSRLTVLAQNSVSDFFARIKEFIATLSIK